MRRDGRFQCKTEPLVFRCSPANGGSCAPTGCRGFFFLLGGAVRKRRVLVYVDPANYVNPLDRPMAGLHGEVETKKISFRIVYRDHFVDRLTKDEKKNDGSTRDAVLRHVCDELVVAKITEAIEKPTEGISSGVEDIGSPFYAIIKSPSLSLNMVCEVRRFGDFVAHVQMKSAMIKDPARYHVTRAATVWVNPKIEVVFARGIDPVLQDAVLEDLENRYSTFEEGDAYEVDAGDCVYSADVGGGTVFIDDAYWILESCYIEVS